MSKVGEQESSSEYSQVRLAPRMKVKIKKKKKRKDLQRLRYNVFKARKKSRNKAADFKKKEEQRVERKSSCNRLLPEPNIGIYLNGAVSKQLAQEKRFRMPRGNETIVSNNVMELFDKEDYSSKNSKSIPNADESRSRMTVSNESPANEKADVNNSMKSPVTIDQNNPSKMEVMKSVGRWRWSPITCFEDLCVKICLEKFMNIPLESFPDPLQRTQMLLIDLHMGSYNYSREIESLFTFEESDEETPVPKQFLIDNKKRSIIKRNNNEIARNERRTKLIPPRPQIPRVHNRKNKVPDDIEANDFHIPMKALSLTPVERKMTFTKASYRVSPPSGRDLIEQTYVETPSVIVRATRQEDFHRKEKFNNAIKTSFRGNEGNRKNKKLKKNEIPGKSNLRGSMIIPSSERPLNLDFGQAHNHQAHGQAPRNRRNRPRDSRIDESEISSNVFLQNFKVLSCNDNPSRDTSGWSRKQGRGYADDVQQPNKYFAGRSKSISLDFPRPIPVYHHKDKRRKRDYAGGNSERTYDPVRRYSTTHGYHNSIDPLNSRGWISPEPQRNRVHKTHKKEVSNSKIALDTPNFFHDVDTHYNSFINQFSPIEEKNEYPLHRTVTFNDINSHHYY